MTQKNHYYTHTSPQRQMVPEVIWGIHHYSRKRSTQKYQLASASPVEKLMKSFWNVLNSPVE